MTISAKGDLVEDFRVLETPGHSVGHIVFWRKRDRVLIAGDVVFNMNFLTAMPGLREPLQRFTPDIEQNRRSIQRIAALSNNMRWGRKGLVTYGGDV